jgi:hypothetical protein
MRRQREMAPELLSVPGRHGLGDGLFLQVRDDEHQSWLFHYSFHGRAHAMGLGPVDRVSMEMARAEITRCGAALREDRDPITARAESLAAERPKRERAQTFKEVAELYISKNEESWDSAAHRQQWRSSLKTYAYPFIGNKPID